VDDGGAVGRLSTRTVAGVLPGRGWVGYVGRPMANKPDAGAALNQPVAVKRPLFERVQDWIFQMDIGFGVEWFRVGLFALLVMAVILFYTGTQFTGLRDREGMDLAQLGRNLAAHRGYVTRVIRPMDVGYLQSVGLAPLAGESVVLPELWTPPVYPWVLSLMMRVSRPGVDLSATESSLKLRPDEMPPAGDWQATQLLVGAARTQAERGDRAVVIVAWLFYAVGVVVLYALGRALFDHRVAVLSIFLYLFCDPLLDACLAGKPVAFLAILFMLSAYALVKAEQWSLGGKSDRWVLSALAVCGLVVGLGTLTQYAFISVLVPVLIYAGKSMKRQRWQWKLGICAGAVLLVLLPWMARNWKVSRTAFGLSRFVVTDQPLLLNPDDAAGQLQMERQLTVDTKFRFRQVWQRALVNWDRLYRSTLPGVGASFVMVYFLASLLHRFRREDVFRLRRYVFWSVMAAFGWLGFGGPPGWNFFLVFLPLMMLYGAAFFFVMFERLQFRARWIRRGLVGLFAVLNMMAFVFTILPPEARQPYPPYDGGVVAAMGRTFKQNELLAADIPWAVAWYGDRSAVLLPADEKDYLKINDEIHVFSGIYVTQATLDQVTAIEVMSGQQRFFTSKFTKPAPGFPLQFVRSLTPDGQQVLTSNRPR